MTAAASSVAAAGPDVTPQPALWWPALVALCLGLPAVLFVHAETVFETVATWNSSETYKYAWAVLPTLAYLLWHNRRRFAVLAPSGSASGVLGAAFCALLWIAGDLMNIAEGRQLALVAALGALVLATVGWSVFRVLTPFLVMLVFLVPSGGFLLTPLKHITVGFLQGFAAVSGMPFKHDGFTVFVGAQRYVVINDCAGLPYLLTGLFLGLTLALLIYRNWWKIAALTLLGGVLAVLANGLRVIGIVVYDYTNGSELELFEHGYFELPAVGLCFAVLFVVFARLRPEPGVAPGAGGPRTGFGSVGPSLLAVTLIVAGPLLWRDPPRIPAETKTHGLLPETLSGWTRQSTVTDWQPGVRFESADASLAAYAKGDRKIEIFVAQANSRRDKISGAGIELVGGSGWMPGRQRRLSPCAHTRCYRIRHLKLLLRDSHRVRHVYTAYAVGAETTVSPFDLRLRRAWAGLIGAPVRSMVIAIATDDADGLELRDIGALFEGFIPNDI